MPGNPHPFAAVVVDAADVVKASLRAFIATRTELIVADANELRSLDLADQVNVKLNATGRSYRRDTADTTTPDDGINCIFDANSIRFKLLSVALPAATFTFAGNGTTTVFDLAAQIPSLVDIGNAAVLWFEDGVVQRRGVDFTTAGTAVTRTSAPANGAYIFGWVIGFG